MRKVIAKVKKYFQTISKIESTPRSIAMGFAIGTFIGIFPTPGFSFFLGILIVMLFKRVNKIALFGALVLFNPLVNIPFDIASFALGDFIFRDALIKVFDIKFLDYAYHFTRRFLVGNIIIASAMSVLNYFIVKNILLNIRSKRNKEK
jgi:uncharacterized protein